jgi:hypothetical protein
MRAKIKYICKKFINHQIKKCFLFRCRHSCSHYNATFDWTNQCPLFITVRLIFEINEDDHPSLVTHARDHWWTLVFAYAFVSPGVNSRGELVHSHGASRLRLGDNMFNTKMMNNDIIVKKALWAMQSSFAHRIFPKRTISWTNLSTSCNTSLISSK